VTRLWAAVASAADLDATGRADIARRIERWIDDGGEGVALITCHRVEVYGIGRSPAIEGTAMLSADGAARHLFRVACGLESVIVGEDEVLHQVREALRVTVRRKPDRRLRRLFESAIAVGRAARAGRTASSGNLAQRAVQWLSRKAEIKGGRVVVAGAGRMGSALAHATRVAGADVVIASRDAARAGRLARL
jgi:glutamyl-tRNA reductase